MDRCFVLGDDALYREAAYTALSRGRVANEVFAVGAANDRAEESHGVETSTEPAAVLRGALARSHRQVAATDQLPSRPPGETMDQLCGERDQLRAAVGVTPVDRAHELRRLEAHSTGVRQRLQECVARRDQLHAGLEALGGLRRLTRSDQRRRLEASLADAVRSVRAFSAELDRLSTRRANLDRQVLEHARWLEHNKAALTRVGQLNGAIATRTETLGRWAERTRQPEAIAVLGPPPKRAGDRRAWRAAAGGLEAYRERWGTFPSLDGSDRGRPGAREPADRDALRRLVNDVEVRRLRRDRGLERDFGMEIGR